MAKLVHLTKKNRHKSTKKSKKIQRGGAFEYQVSAEDAIMRIASCLTALKEANTMLCTALVHDNIHDELAYHTCDDKCNNSAYKIFNDYTDINDSVLAQGGIFYAVKKETYYDQVKKGKDPFFKKYSIRIAGQDDTQAHIIQVITENGEMNLSDLFPQYESMASILDAGDHKYFPFPGGLSNVFDSASVGKAPSNTSKRHYHAANTSDFADIFYRAIGQQCLEQNGDTDDAIAKNNGHLQAQIAITLSIVLNCFSAAYLNYNSIIDGYSYTKDSLCDKTSVKRREVLETPETLCGKEESITAQSGGRTKQKGGSSAASEEEKKKKKYKNRFVLPTLYFIANFRVLHIDKKCTASGIFGNRNPIIDSVLPTIEGIATANHLNPFDDVRIYIDDDDNTGLSMKPNGAAPIDLQDTAVINISQAKMAAHINKICPGRASGRSKTGADNQIIKQFYIYLRSYRVSQDYIYIYLELLARLLKALGDRGHLTLAIMYSAMLKKNVVILTGDRLLDAISIKAINSISTPEIRSKISISINNRIVLQELNQYSNLLSRINESGTSMDDLNICFLFRSLDPHIKLQNAGILLFTLLKEKSKFFDQIFKLVENFTIYILLMYILLTEQIGIDVVDRPNLLLQAQSGGSAEVLKTDGPNNDDNTTSAVPAIHDSTYFDTQIGILTEKIKSLKETYTAGNEDQLSQLNNLIIAHALLSAFKSYIFVNHDDPNAVLNTHLTEEEGILDLYSIANEPAITIDVPESLDDFIRKIQESIQREKAIANYLLKKQKIELQIEIFEKFLAANSKLKKQAFLGYRVSVGKMYEYLANPLEVPEKYNATDRDATTRKGYFTSKSVKKNKKESEEEPDEFFHPFILKPPTVDSPKSIFDHTHTISRVLTRFESIFVKLSLDCSNTYFVTKSISGICTIVNLLYSIIIDIDSLLDVDKDILLKRLIAILLDKSAESSLELLSILVTANNTFLNEYNETLSFEENVAVILYKGPVVRGYGLELSQEKQQEEQLLVNKLGTLFIELNELLTILSRYPEFFLQISPSVEATVADYGGGAAAPHDSSGGGKVYTDHKGGSQSSVIELSDANYQAIIKTQFFIPKVHIEYLGTSSAEAEKAKIKNYIISQIFPIIPNELLNYPRFNEIAANYFRNLNLPLENIETEGDYEEIKVIESSCLEHIVKSLFFVLIHEKFPITLQELLLEELENQIQESLLLLNLSKLYHPLRLSTLLEFDTALYNQLYNQFIFNNATDLTIINSRNALLTDLFELDSDGVFKFPATNKEFLDRLSSIDVAGELLKQINQTLPITFTFKSKIAYKDIFETLKKKKDRLFTLGELGLIVELFDRVLKKVLSDPAITAEEKMLLYALQISAPRGQEFAARGLRSAPSGRRSAAARGQRSATIRQQPGRRASTGSTMSPPNLTNLIQQPGKKGSSKKQRSNAPLLNTLPEGSGSNTENEDKPSRKSRRKRKLVGRARSVEADLSANPFPLNRAASVGADRPANLFLPPSEAREEAGIPANPYLVRRSFSESAASEGTLKRPALGSPQILRKIGRSRKDARTEPKPFTWKKRGGYLKTKSIKKIKTKNHKNKKFTSKKRKRKYKIKQI